MNLKEIATYSNVRRFQLFNGNLFYIYDKNQLKIEGLKADVNFGKAQHSSDLFILDRLLIWSSARGHSLAYDLINETVIFEDTSGDNYCTIPDIGALVEGKLFYYNRLVDGTNQYFLFDFVSKNIQEFPCKIRKVISYEGNSILLDWDIDNGNDLIRFNTDGELIWRFPINGTFLNYNRSVRDIRVQRVLGVYNDLLWIILANEDLIGVDIVYGKEVYSFKAGRHIQLDTNLGEIVGCLNNMLYRIDLNEEKLMGVNVDFSSSALQHDIQADYKINGMTFDNEYIYFSDMMRGKIGLLDRTTVEVIEVMDLKLDLNSIDNIEDLRVHGNKLYALDWRHVVHEIEMIE